MLTIEGRVEHERHKEIQREVMLSRMMETLPLAQDSFREVSLMRHLSESKKWLRDCFDSFARDWP